MQHLGARLLYPCRLFAPVAGREVGGPEPFSEEAVERYIRTVRGNGEKATMEGKKKEGRSDPAAARLLPEQFQDLAPFLDWALATEPERSAKRQASPMEEIDTFYQAIFSRMKDILPFLDQFTSENAPDDVQHLFHLTLSLAEVAPAVENYGQPNVVDGYDVTRFIENHEQLK